MDPEVGRAMVNVPERNHSQFCVVLGGCNRFPTVHALVFRSLGSCHPEDYGRHHVWIAPFGQGAEMMLLWLSRGVFEEFVDAAGDVSFEAASDLSGGLAFGESSGGVGLGFGVAAESAEGDGVQGAVELTVATSVESMAGGLA